MTAGAIDEGDRRRAVARLPRRVVGVLAGVVGSVLVAGCGFMDEDVIPGDLPADATNVLFLHHSTGENVWNGGVQDVVDSYNDAHGTDYNVLERWFPHPPYPDNENDPYDFWKVWVDASGEDTYEGQETLEQLTEAYDVIVWKNCYLASDLEPDTGAPDVASPRKTVANHKLQLLALRRKMHEFPDTTFLVWTVPPKVAGETTPEIARRAQRLVAWQRGVWDQPGDNVYLWDYQALATEGGLYLTDDHATGPADSHPDEEFSAEVAPLFVNRLAEVIEGRGDQTSLTGR